MTYFHPLLLLFLSIPSSLAPEPPKSLDSFADFLNELFESHSHSPIIQKSIDEILPKVRVRSESADSALRSSTTRLTKLFNDRITALKKLTESAEIVTDFYEDSSIGEEQLSIDDTEICDAIQSRQSRSDVKNYSHVRNNSTGIHINVESYACDPTVVRDFEWTGADHLTKTFHKNAKTNPEIASQFIGTYSGVTRMFPARPWVIDPPLITVDLFDPKFRPWFVNAESPPKDVVFLIDYSGSMKGPTMHLTKITLMYIMSTLSPNDFFYGIWFNAAFAPVLPCSNRTFLPATTSNKKIFYEKLAELEEKDQAHLGPPIKFSLDALRQMISSDLSWARSGGHKMVMLFTDGIDEWPEQTVNEEIINHKGDKIRIFGFALGWGTGHLPMLAKLACLTNASYSVVDSIADVKPEARSYLDHLSFIQGLQLAEQSQTPRPISWTNLYMDTQGAGPTLTLSSPIPIQPKTIWHTQRLAGVAGVDINIKEITDRLPQSEQIYGMVVDNNGIVIYHPNHELPKTEVHNVRRSACYDAASVKAKAGAGLRVQYGFSDERVYRLVGLIDSIPTIDMFDLEEQTHSLAEIRKRVIERNCTEEPLHDGERDLYCSNIKGTPFSLLIVNSHVRETLAVSERTPSISHSANDMVSTVITNSELCNWALDKTSIHFRFDAFARLDGCGQDVTLARTLGNALQPWVDSWPQSEGNASCLSTPFPSHIPRSHFVNSFVHSRAQITSFYPTCSYNNMKAVIRKFDKERLQKENSSDLQFSIRNDILVVYRPILDKFGNRIVTVGTQWRINYLHQLFRNWTHQHGEEWRQFKGKDVLLVTRSGWVVGSTKRSPAHLTKYDPQLFYSLVKQKMIQLIRNVDVQAECVARRVAPWASTAPSRRPFYRILIDTIVKMIGTSFWIDLYLLISSFVSAQPTWQGGKCQFQKIKPFERCSMETFDYKMTLNIKKQFQMDGGNCPRYLHVFPVAHTTLTLIMVDKPCVHYKPPKTYINTPRKLEGCEVVTLYYRKQREDLNYNTTHPDEVYPECAHVNGMSTTGHLLSILIHLLIFSFSS